MCGIAGFCNPEMNYESESVKWNRILEDMNRVQKRRGPDDEGIYVNKGCGLAHVRLSIIDLVTGHQPMIRKEQERECSIVFNGEIYNMKELKEELREEGARFETTSDTEVVLTGYMYHGPDYVKKLNGIFTMAIWDSGKESLYLFRDRLGVKPLFYTMAGRTLVFSSEIKGLFEYPGIKPQIDRSGLCEIFALGPAKSYGRGVFKDVMEVLPGQMIHFAKNTWAESFYWKLQSRPHEDSYAETVEKTAWLVEDSVKKQMLSGLSRGL